MTYNRKEYFDNLSQRVDVSFDTGKGEMAKQITSELKDGGIFCFIKHEVKKINNVSMHGRNTTELKRVDVIAYLLKMTNNLAISPSNNVSQNSGFK